MNQELDALNSRKMALEDELAMSQVKKEAVVLYDQLREVEDKRDQVGRETVVQHNLMVQVSQSTHQLPWTISKELIAALICMLSQTPDSQA